MTGSVRVRWRRAAALAAALAVAGCQAAVLDPRGDVARADRTILVDSVAIMLAIVVPTILATLAFAWWYRASNRRARYQQDFVYSGRVELIVWSIPVLVIVLLGGVAWIGAHDLDPAHPVPGHGPALEVQVVALDWKWLFIYPAQHVAAVNQLVLPVGVPVHFSLTSASVLNVFFVPQLGSMIYAMNGMRSDLNLNATQPGVYAGRAAHINGDGFPGMYFDVRAVPATEFDGWIRTTQTRGDTLDAPRYAELARQSMNVPPFTYRGADPTLFQRIVTQQIPPGPGPQTGRPDPTVKPKSEPADAG